MNINIDTKYNIGDTVYTAYCYYEYIPMREPFIVKNILISGDINHSHIIYEIEQDLFIDHAPENCLFSTYAECVQWCKKHNLV